MDSPVDLTNCDREPIHALGRVQPFGFLLGLTSDWMISHVSENIAKFSDADWQALIGREASEVLSRDTIHAIRNKLPNVGARGGLELLSCVSFGNEGDRFDLSIHVSGETIVLEFEPHNGTISVADEISNVQGAIDRLSKSQTVEQMMKFTVPRRLRRR